MLHKLALTIAVLAALGGSIGHTAEAGYQVNPLHKSVKQMTLKEQLRFYTANVQHAKYTIAWYHGQGSWTLNSDRYPAAYSTANINYKWYMRLLKNATRNMETVKAKLQPKPIIPTVSLGGICVSCWEAVASCESGNNWSDNTGNGFFGGLQFTIGTWLSAGGGKYASRADYATEAEQIAIASTLSLSNWPVCGARY